MNLSKKTFLAFLAFIIAPMFVLGVVAYSMSQELIVKKFGDQSEITLKAIGRNIRDVLKEANYFSDFWMVKDSIQGMYRVLDQMQATGQPLSSYELNEMDTVLRGTLLTYAPIQSVALFNKDGQSISAGRMTNSPLSFQELKASGSFPAVTSGNGVPVWIGPKEDPSFPAAARDFYQVRIVKDFWTMDDRGYMLLRFRFPDWNAMFQLYDSGAGSDRARRYMLLDRNGLVLFDTFQELEGTWLPLSIMGHGGGGSTDDFSYKGDFRGETSLISLHRLDMDELGARGWSLVSVTSWKYVAGEMTSIMNGVIGIMILCLVCALLYNLVFVRRMIGLLLRVVASMKKVERGDLTTRVHVAGKDETMVLAKGFNSLVARIEDLLEEVKREQERKNKAELMLLQAQIKPHFLFNTLESINVLAIQNQGKKVSHMVHRLGSLLRISIDKREEVPLRQELAHLRSYLEIQSFRFEDLFSFEIDVPEELLETTILKLTLQPLVENSIQHGFDGLERLGRSGRIAVRARDEGSRVALCVEDNGIGIEAQRLAGFRYHEQGWRGSDGLLSEAAAAEEEAGTAGGGLGVANVADRLRIRYGSPYGLYICSVPGEGTKIKLLVPKATAAAEERQEGDGE